MAKTRHPLSQASIKPGNHVNWVRTQCEQLKSLFESSSDVLNHNHVCLVSGPAGGPSLRPCEVKY